VAQEALFARRVFGIIEIPPDTEREVLKGNAARVPAYVDSAYFLLFNRTLQGILEGADTNLTNASLGNRLDGAAIQTALAVQSPIETVLKPLYNPTGGYASYVVPAAFVLIIQQTLLMGAATLTGLGFSQQRASARFSAAPADVLGQSRT
jgi:ABC-2 type transport system permease protein